MRVLEVRNVHAALPAALELLHEHGVSRDSRYGRVRQAPWPVCTVYQQPQERLLLWHERDANPFFHLYESLWMLAGRNDLKPLLRYVKTFADFSDDGVTIHDAYGHRWRKHFGFDQLTEIIYSLGVNSEDRRCVLQMWDPRSDLGKSGKTFPCNTAATFQVSPGGELEMTVFCRSNDIVMGAYGANAVHFSVLQEYVARMILAPIGPYRQISVNWHAYDKTLTPKIASIRKAPDVNWQPYEARGCVRKLDLFNDLDRKFVIPAIIGLLDRADCGVVTVNKSGIEWLDVIDTVLAAHTVYSNDPVNAHLALARLDDVPQDIDWVVAARDWINRRIERRREVANG